MSEDVAPPKNSLIHQLYVEKISRFGFELAEGELSEALLGMYSEEVKEQLGQRALFLYSSEQVQKFRPFSDEQAKSEMLDSVVAKQIKPLRTRQYKPARWAGVSRTNSGSTKFHFNLALDAQTQELLHACKPAGLNQSKFGLKVMEVSHTISNGQMVQASQKKQISAASLRSAVWANDDPEAEPNPIASAKDQHNCASNINWKTRVRK